MHRLLVVLCILALSRNVLGQAAAQETPEEPAREASEDIWKKCRGNDTDARLTACSTLIAHAQGTPAELASAYYARGSAYRQKSLFALALKDFDEAIKANPDLT
jgi:tetratricopeptide (TPR) repeat protein